MAYNIVHCSIDERGKISGGTPGDQTGKECCIRSYYIKTGGWDVVIRHPSIEVAKNACEIANKLANSNLVGYNQYKRMSLYKALKKNNWDVDKFINSGEKVDADCSSFLYAVWCCLLPDLRGESNAPCTSTYRQFYSKHGFICYTDSKYTCSGDYLLPGDMINKSSSHVVMFTSTGYKNNNSNPSNNSGVASCSPNLKFGSKGEQVKLLQSNLNKVIGAGLNVDGDFGKNTKNALKVFQNKYGLEVDGIYGRRSREKMVMLTSTGSNTNKSNSSGVASCSPNLKFGSKGEQVKLLQANLNKVIGAGLNVDGDFGKNTKNALKAFQNKYGLEVDGIYGRRSREKMIELY